MSQVEELVRYDVAKIVSGGWNTHAITVQGQLLTWGNGSFGQLGYGVWGAVTEPALVTAAEKLFVLDSAIGHEHALMIAGVICH